MNIKKIILKSRKGVFGDMLGNNASRFIGEGFEFAEIREYNYGDDVRKIDWKQSAKLGIPQVKIYHEERAFNVVTACMMSGGLYFGTAKQKVELMAEVVAMIGWSSIKNSDNFSNILFSETLHHFTKPTKKLFALHEVLKSIDEFELLGKKADYKAFTLELYKRIKKRSLLFLICDGVGEIDVTLLSKKHDIIAIILRDRFEESPVALGHIGLSDMQSLKSFEADLSDSAIGIYTKRLKDNDEKLYANFKKNSVRFVKIYTDENPYQKIRKVLGVV